MVALRRQLDRLWAWLFGTPAKSLSEYRTVGVQAFVVQVEESNLDLHGGACVRRSRIEVSRHSRWSLGTH